MLDLYLASTSPRRSELMKTLGRPFTIISPHADETLPEGLAAQEVAERLAVRKAESVAVTLCCGLVLGADTLVVAGDRIIGKPRDQQHAVEILKRLSSAPHQVVTGVCLINAASGQRRVASEITRVVMRTMSHDEIEEYVASGEAMGKAGAYAIQETGDQFVERVEGSMSNVVGLPIELIRQLITEMETNSKEG